MKDMNVPAVLNKGYKGSHTISDISSWCTNLKYIIQALKNMNVPAVGQHTPSIAVAGFIQG